MVVDPIQSVKGKVVIDAFRTITPQSVLSGQEPRQTTSNIGHINKPSIQALIHGLNRHYYSIAVNYRKTELEQAMLMNLHKRNWTEGLKLRDFKLHKETNEKAVKVRALVLISPRRRGDRHWLITVDACAVRSIQQVSARRIDANSRAAQDTTCRKTGSKATSRGSRREGNGRSGGTKLGDYAPCGVVNALIRLPVSFVF